MPRPFTTEDYTARMARATADAAAAGLSGLVVAPGPDLVYLCGYQPTAITERLTALLLTDGREPALIVPKLERPDAERATGAPGLRLLDWTDGESPYDTAVPLLDPMRPLRRLGQRLGDAPARPPGRPAGQPAGPRSPRRCRCSGRSRTPTSWSGWPRPAAPRTPPTAASWRCGSPALRETDVAADLSALLIQYGHSQVDFTVVGSGPNGANPHHEAGDRVIEAGDTVVLDFGGLKDGYGSDTTRTVHVGTDVPAEVRTVHDVVRQAQQTAFEAVRPGVTCQEIDRIARRVITEAGYGEYFIHRTGHGIGITTHEPPYLVEGEEQPLVPGMCFSIEPGVYLPGRFGVRIEDIVTVTDQGGRMVQQHAPRAGHRLLTTVS